MPSLEFGALLFQQTSLCLAPPTTRKIFVTLKRCRHHPRIPRASLPSRNSFLLQPIWVLSPFPRHSASFLRPLPSTLRRTHPLLVDIGAVGVSSMSVHQPRHGAVNLAYRVFSTAGCVRSSPPDYATSIIDNTLSLLADDHHHPTTFIEVVEQS